MTIEWQPYLTVEGQPLRQATDDDIVQLENYLGKALPEDFRQLIKEHQGQIANNLVVQVSSGNKPGFSCVLHAICDEDQVPEELESYGIDWMTEVVSEELGHHDVLVFSRKGNSIYALDYSDNPTSPTVVLIDGDYEAGEPGAKKVIAHSITEFLDRYAVT